MSMKISKIIKTGVFVIAGLNIGSLAMAGSPAFYIQKAYGQTEVDTTDEITYDETEDVDIASIRSSNIAYCEVNQIASVTYTGNELKPEVKVYNSSNEKLVEGTDYTLTYKDNIYVNDYYDDYQPRVIIKGIGNYTGITEEKFTIKKVKVTDSNVTVSNLSNYTYDGNEHIANPTVKVDDKRIYEGSGYWTQSTNCTSVGIANVSIRFDGNYSGTITKNYYILPSKVKINSYESLSKATATIHWTTNKAATGYIIYKKKSDTSSYEKIAEIDDNNASSYTIKNIVAGETVNIKMYAYKKYDDGKIKYSPACNYSFKQGKTVTEIKAKYLTSNSVKLAVGQSRKIAIMIYPSDALDKTYTWTSANKSIAKVDANGKITGVKEGTTTVTATANDSGKKKLKITVTITKRASSNTCSESALSIVATDHAKYTYDEMAQDISQLTSKYGEFLTAKSLGNSYDGRKIYEVTLGNPNAAKQMVVVGTTHAREYMNSILVMKQIELYCANYYSGVYGGKYYSEIFENTCIHFIPMLNPDGVTISQVGPSGIKNATLRNNLYKMYSKYGGGLDKTTYFTRWKANGRGVDLNRNYYVPGNVNHFGEGHPGADGYYGTKAESEVETQYLVGVMNRVKPRAIISYHSTGSQIYWKYGQTGTQLTNSRILFNITQSLNRYEAINKVSTGPGFSDWVSNVKKIPAMTVETGTTICPLKISEWAGVWSRNKYVTLAQAKAVWDYNM